MMVVECQKCETTMIRSESEQEEGWQVGIYTCLQCKNEVKIRRKIAVEV